MQDELRAQTYQPGKYHSFYIHEPKRRLISAAPFRDRVVHHALCSVIEPWFERRFIHDSYANRAGKGTHRALDRCQAFARKYPYALQMDIVQFFPSIDHALLRAAIAKVIRDDAVLWLCDVILRSGEGVQAGEYQTVYFPGDDLFAALRPRGLPIGNLTSQFWANVYLNALDQFVKRRLPCRAYVRYVDDMIVYAAEKRTLWEWRAAVIELCAQLRLTVHEERAIPRPVSEGLPFLGFTVYPAFRRLKASKAVSFRRKFKCMMKQLKARQIDLITVNASVRGWVNHTRYGDTWGLRRSILSARLSRPKTPLELEGEMSTP